MGPQSLFPINNVISSFIAPSLKTRSSSPWHQISQLAHQMANYLMWLRFYKNCASLTGAQSYYARGLDFQSSSYFSGWPLPHLHLIYISWFPLLLMSAPAQQLSSNWVVNALHCQWQFLFSSDYSRQRGIYFFLFAIAKLTLGLLLDCVLHSHTVTTKSK